MIVSSWRQSGGRHGVPSFAQTDSANHVASPAGAEPSWWVRPVRADPQAISVAPKSSVAHGRGSPVVVGVLVGRVGLVASGGAGFPGAPSGATLTAGSPEPAVTVGAAGARRGFLGTVGGFSVCAVCAVVGTTPTSAAGESGCGPPGAPEAAESRRESDAEIEVPGAAVDPPRADAARSLVESSAAGSSRIATTRMTRTTTAMPTAPAPTPIALRRARLPASWRTSVRISSIDRREGSPRLGCGGGELDSQPVEAASDVLVHGGGSDVERRDRVHRRAPEERHEHRGLALAPG